MSEEGGVVVNEEQFRFRVNTLEPGEVLLVTVDQRLKDSEATRLKDRLCEDLVGTRFEGKTILLFVNGLDIRALSEENMRRLGWVKLRAEPANP